MIAVIIIFAIIIWMSCQLRSANTFKENAQRVCVGMNVNDVVSIMGSPSFVKNYQDGSYEYVYEKGEWKGMFRGGTRTRRMEIVFSSQNIVISIGRNRDSNMSAW